MRTKHPVIAMIKYISPTTLTAGYLAKYNVTDPSMVGAYLEGRTSDDRPVYLRIRSMFGQSAGITGDIEAMRKLAARLVEVADAWERRSRSFRNETGIDTAAACDTITRASQ